MKFRCFDSLYCNIIFQWPTANPLKLLNLSPAIKLAKSAPILQSKASPRGTQLKLELMLLGSQTAYFKPQFYPKEVLLNGTVYGGKDRHFGEIAAFYLNLILGYFNGPIVVGRTLDLRKEVVKKAKDKVKETFHRMESKFTWGNYTRMILMGYFNKSFMFI
jgi:hypothetical protein